MKNDALIMLATQKNASDDDPATADSSYEIGTLASVLQLLKLPDGTVKVLVEGLERAKVEKYTDRSEYYEATAVALADYTRRTSSKPRRWRVRSSTTSKAM
jgi:ATP-dependent Lon protease